MEVPRERSGILPRKRQKKLKEISKKEKPLTIDLHDHGSAHLSGSGSIVSGGVLVDDQALVVGVFFRTSSEGRVRTARGVEVVPVVLFSFRLHDFGVFRLGVVGKVGGTTGTGSG